MASPVLEELGPIHALRLLDAARHQKLPVFLLGAIRSLTPRHVSKRRKSQSEKCGNLHQRCLATDCPAPARPAKGRQARGQAGGRRFFSKTQVGHTNRISAEGSYFGGLPACCTPNRTVVRGVASIPHREGCGAGWTDACSGGRACRSVSA